jgi:hypothetical protein
VAAAGGAAAASGGAAAVATTVVGAAPPALAGNTANLAAMWGVTAVLDVFHGLMSLLSGILFFIWLLQIWAQLGPQNAPVVLYTSIALLLLFTLVKVGLSVWFARWMRYNAPQSTSADGVDAVEASEPPLPAQQRQGSSNSMAARYGKLKQRWRTGWTKATTWLLDVLARVYLLVCIAVYPLAVLGSPTLLIVLLSVRRYKRRPRVLRIVVLGTAVAQTLFQLVVNVVVVVLIGSTVQFSTLATAITSLVTLLISIIQVCATTPSTLSACALALTSCAIACLGHTLTGLYGAPRL